MIRGAVTEVYFYLYWRLHHLEDMGYHQHGELVTTTGEALLCATYHDLI